MIRIARLISIRGPDFARLSGLQGRVSAVHQSQYRGLRRIDSCRNAGLRIIL